MDGDTPGKNTGRYRVSAGRNTGGGIQSEYRNSSGNRPARVVCNVSKIASGIERDPLAQSQRWLHKGPWRSNFGAELSGRSVYPKSSNGTIQTVNCVKEFAIWPDRQTLGSAHGWVLRSHTVRQDYWCFSKRFAKRSHSARILINPEFVAFVLAGSARLTLPK